MTRSRTRPGAVPLALVALAYVLALVQRPGTLVADTKVDLHVDARSFLAEVLSAWTPTGDLGHVWAGQYGGYAWPMASWFAAGEALGLPAWLAHRLWVGTILAVAAVGMVRLLDALVTAGRGPLHVAAGVLYVVNPYVTVYLGRTSVALLAHAALPWLLLLVHRGLREPQSWRWPAAFALVLASTGGGVNAATTAWALAGPALLVLYELGPGGVAVRSLLPWGARMAATVLVAQAWWIVPVLVAAAYGTGFLPFTEQPGSIWGTTSLSESLRLMGFWTSYIGVGYGGRLVPFSGSSDALLFHAGVVAASLVVPALALTGLAWTRRGRYAPFFALLVLIGIVVMAAGFPEGTPLRRALTFTYNRVEAVQVLRTSYKAGPLVALGIAALAGLALRAAWERLPGRGGRALLAAGAAGLAAAASWPLVSGRAPERQLAFAVPPAYEQAARALDARGTDTRVLQLPGQLFAYAEWGGTIDPLLPVLMERPVATRALTPYADLRAVELQWAVDDLVTQERVLPGQLPDLLDLLGVGDVVLSADGDVARAGQLPPAEAARALRGQGLGFDRAFGPARDRPAAADRLAGPVRLPQLAVARTRTGGLLRVLPRGPLTVVDGGAAGLTGLAGFGALGLRRPHVYAPDLTREAIRRAAAAGADLVVADGNRRQAFVSSRPRGNRGPVLRADQDVSEDGTMLDPFGGRDPATQTVALQEGARLSAPLSPQVTQVPEHRPFAAVDGDPDTAWLADRLLARERHALTVAFPTARDVPWIELLPFSNAFGRVRAVEVEGRRFAVRPGLNRLELGLRGVRELTVALARVEGPRRRSSGAGGIRELRIPGLAVRERLRPPVVLERALRGADLGAAGLAYLFARQTADAPRRAARLAGGEQGGDRRDAGDAEDRIERRIAPPAARTWRAEAWVRADPGTPDAALDRLAGVRGGGLRAESSSRFDGLPRHRASGAFDGGDRAWIGQWIPGRPAWLGFELARERTLRELRLEPVAARVRRPLRVRLDADGARGPEAAVDRDGRVLLPRRVRGRAFRLHVVAAAFPPGTPARTRRRRAVGIAELRAPGVPRLRVPRAGPLRAACGAVAAGVFRPGGRALAARLAMEVRGRLEALDAGRELRATPCGRPGRLPAGPLDVTALGGTLRADHLRLVSRPRGNALPALLDGEVRPGRLEFGERRGASARVDGPAWLVHGESYSRGWRADCDGRDLGEPVPLQGYANAWPIDAPGCADLELTFAPNAAVRAASALSLGAAPVLLGLVLWPAMRRRRTAAAAPAATPTGLPDPDADPARVRRPLRTALLLGAAAGALTGFVFALRVGVLAGPAVALVLWRGIPSRSLILAAGGLLALVVPALYLLFPGRDRGGYSTTYPAEHLWAHWVTVAAVVLLATAVARQLALSTARGRRGAPAAGPPGEGGPR